MKLLICTQAVDKNHPALGFFHSWIEEFAAHFDEIYVICLIKGEYTLPSNVHVYSLGKENGENRLKYVVRFYTFFSRIFFKVHVDYVFYHMGSIYNILGAPFFLLRSFFNTKFYWWKTHGLINLLGRVALLLTDSVFTAGSKSFPVNTKKLVVVGHAIDCAQFTINNNKPVELRALVVGRIVPIKEIEFTIEIMHLLNQKKSELNLRVIGSADNSEYLQTLKLLCEHLCVTEKVNFVGSLKQQELQK
jgi:glycosyltransferase involved in cell wall biosynthesis